MLLAPHHGSAKANTPLFADWGKPRVVIASQGANDSTTARKSYTPGGAQYLTTAAHGAVTVRTRRGGMVVETFLTKERFVFRSTDGTANGSGD